MAQSRKNLSSKAPAGRNQYFLPLLAVICAAAIYLGAAGFPFVFDDLRQILHNPRVQSWSYLPHYFTESLWSHLPAAPNSYYRPLFLVWMLLNYQAFGPNPMGWHLAGVLLHAGVTWLVYRLAVRELQDGLAAGFAAIIFALHPVHVEGVVWISGLNEPLYAAFFVATLLCYFRWKDGDGDEWMAASLICFALSMLAKETAIIAPAMVLLYEWRSRTQETTSARIKATLRNVASYIVVALLYLGVRAYGMRNTVALTVKHPSIPSVILTLPAALWFYLQKLAVPWPMAVFYPLIFVEHPRLWNFWLPLLGVLVAGAALWTWAKRDPRVPVACWWLFLPVLPPLLAIVRFLPGDLVHDRYMYVPSVGFSMLAAIALRRIPCGRRTLWGVPAVQFAAVAAVGAAFAFAGVKQADYWSSDLVLYSRAVEVSPDDAVALNQLGSEFSHLGQDDRAVVYLERAIQNDPDNYRSLLLLGITENNLGRYDRAIPALLHARELHPKGGIADFFLGLAQVDAHQFAVAEVTLRHAIELVPGKFRQHYLLGLALENQGRLREAREEFLKELQLDPTSSDANDKLRELDSQAGSSVPER
ncbi:MAG: tetratricopeptide repeat protein [Terriglobales bacterium]